MIATERGGRSQPLQPPYLVTVSTDRRGLLVGIVADASTAVVELAVHGPWSQRLGTQVAAILRLCLAGPSVSIIVDLHDLGDPQGLSLPFWLEMSREGLLGTVPVQLALCVPATTMLDSRLRQSNGHVPLVFTAVAEARLAVASWLPRVQRYQVRLAPRAASVRAARDLVARACRAWGLSQVQDARLVISELVANAVEHARTDFVITVSTTGDTNVHVAVRDGVTGFPKLNQPRSTSRPGLPHERGRGLWLVHAAAVVWGAMPARGGKVVWATVPPPNQGPPSGQAGISGG